VGDWKRSVGCFVLFFIWEGVVGCEELVERFVEELFEVEDARVSLNKGSW
jgi:hypothetical protein